MNAELLSLHLILGTEFVYKPGYKPEASVNLYFGVEHIIGYRGIGGHKSLGLNVLFERKLNGGGCAQRNCGLIFMYNGKAYGFAPLVRAGGD